MSAPDDLAVITAYFNPQHYRSRRENLRIFREAILQTGIGVFIVECTLPGSAFELPREWTCARLTANSALWQKEALLNVAAREVPAAISKLAWLDGDVLFQDREWAVRTSKALDDFSVVQPFDRVVLLPKGAVADTGTGVRYESFAAAYSRDPIGATLNGWRRHGHTGFAWSARREVLEDGLYDACMSGSADHLMAHAFIGDWESPCVDRLIGENESYRCHFESWCTSVYPRVRARVGCVPGKLLHLWHGDESRRRYPQQADQLGAFDFDPFHDIKIGTNGCLEWGSEKPELHRWAKRYFASRCEDGEPRRSEGTREQLLDRLERACDRACSDEHARCLTVAIETVRSAKDEETARRLALVALGLLPRRIQP